MLSCVQDLSKIPSVKGGNAVKICVEDKEPSTEAKLGADDSAPSAVLPRGAAIPSSPHAIPTKDDQRL